MRLLTLFIVLLSSNALEARSGASYRPLLDSLDIEISRKNIYDAQRRDSITAALGNLAEATTDDDRYNVYRRLYGLYRSYRGDSAMWVAEKRLATATALNDSSRIISATLNLAESYSMAGDYYHALQLLDSIDRSAMQPYHRHYLMNLYSTTYSRMAKSDGVKSHRLIFEDKVRAYRDSALQLLTDDDRQYYSLKAWQLMTAGHWQEALDTMEAAQRRFGEDENARSKAQMAIIYNNLHDYDSEISSLAEASITDIRQGRRDHSILMDLAQRLNEAGDTERAYKYIRCALDDAYFCNAKARTAEILELIPIIDAAYHESEAKRSDNLRLMSILISALAIALAAALWIAHKRLAANRIIRRQLDERNRQLAEINSQLIRQNRTREKYISDLFDAHSGYINRTSLFRKNIGRLMKAGQYADVLEQVKSNRTDNSELKELYARFDTIFLSMYPDFISDINGMLRDECRIDPACTQLTSELRVLALMKTGIYESSRIAAMLHYTPQTVYNYKFAIRNSLAIPKEDFDRWITSTD